MRQSKSKQIAWLEIFFAAAMIVIGTVLPLFLFKYHKADNQMPAWGLELVAMFGLGLQFLIYLTSSSRRPLKAYLLVATPVSILLFIAALN